jgi:dihydroorotate dehydrogenase
MKLGKNNVDFGNSFIASGGLNFFGDGWKYDKLFKRFVPGFKKVIEATTFVAKTTTLDKRDGNMPLTKDLQPKEIKPRCIKIYFFKGAVLNSVGLSGPGAQSLIYEQKWQYIEKPFFISFMALKDNAIGRLYETRQFVDMLKKELPYFYAPIGLQINVSCPNTNHDTKELSKEALDILKVASELGVPLDLKINIFMRSDTVKAIEDSGLCDMITISNTIPFGTPGVGIDWNKFGKGGISPLKDIGGGGLSGAPILPCVLKRISELRRDGIKMLIKGSGGIMTASDVDKMKSAGANAIEIGTVLMLRPWRALAIIKRSKQIFS